MNLWPWYRESKFSWGWCWRELTKLCWWAKYLLNAVIWIGQTVEYEKWTMNGSGACQKNYYAGINYDNWLEPQRNQKISGERWQHGTVCIDAWLPEKTVVARESGSLNMTIEFSMNLSNGGINESEQWPEKNVKSESWWIENINEWKNRSLTV